MSENHDARSEGEAGDPTGGGDEPTPPDPKPKTALVTPAGSSEPEQGASQGKAESAQADEHSLRARAVEIPAPKLEGGPKRGLNLAAVVAMLAFVLVGGVLVFGFAQMLVPAAEAQLGAACRPLSPEPKSGELPELELEDLAGNPVSLADFRGKFLVVNFWATWCQPCTREWPDLDTLSERLSERDDVAVIAISVDQEPEAIAPYLERMGLTDTRVTILRAKPADAQKLFGSEKIPDTYFVNREGQFESVFVNVREWGRAKAVRCVEASADRG